MPKKKKELPEGIITTTGSRMRQLLNASRERGIQQAIQFKRGLASTEPTPDAPGCDATSSGWSGDYNPAHGGDPNCVPSRRAARRAARRASRRARREG